MGQAIDYTGSAVTITEQNIVSMDACAYGPRTQDTPSVQDRKLAREYLWFRGTVIGVDAQGKLVVDFHSAVLAMRRSWVTVLGVHAGGVT